MQTCVAGRENHRTDKARKRGNNLFITSFCNAVWGVIFRPDACGCVSQQSPCACRGRCPHRPARIHCYGTRADVSLRPYMGSLHIFFADSSFDGLRRVDKNTFSHRFPNFCASYVAYIRSFFFGVQGSVRETEPDAYKTGAYIIYPSRPYCQGSTTPERTACTGFPRPSPTPRRKNAFL